MLALELPDMWDLGDGRVAILTGSRYPTIVKVEGLLKEEINEAKKKDILDILSSEFGIDEDMVEVKEDKEKIIIEFPTKYVAENDIPNLEKRMKEKGYKVQSDIKKKILIIEQEIDVQGEVIDEQYEAYLAEREFTPDKRKELADKGQALPDGSFPIVNVEDLKNAISAHGRAKDKEKAKAHIKKRAKTLGKTDLIPDKWKKAA